MSTAEVTVIMRGAGDTEPGRIVLPPCHSVGGGAGGGPPHPLQRHQQQVERKATVGRAGSAVEWMARLHHSLAALIDWWNIRYY